MLTLWALVVGPVETVTAAPEASPAIELQIVDRAGVSATELAEAQAETARIFDLAGIGVLWVEQAPISAGAPIRFTIVLGSGQASDTASAARNQHVLGAAMRPAGRAYVYVDRVRQRASDRQVPVALLLGRAIAHEVGHLVLPNDGHSSSGIMAARLHTHRDGATLTFTPKERADILARLVTQ
jgi:hypothetical protein